MTTLSYTQITGLAPPSLAPSSSGPSRGSNIGTYAGTTWKTAADATETKNRKQRRAALAKAREAVESRPQETKQERLTRLTSNRDTGTESERRATRGSLAKAAAALADVPMEIDFSSDEFRQIRESLRQLYPGARLSEMLAEGARLEKMLIDDPVSAHAAIWAAYSRTKAAAEYQEPKHSKGLRGSLERAKIDQEDAADLKDWIARYGKRLPQIMAELHDMDRALRQNPNFEAAKLAARHGAPILEHEIPIYEAKQAAKVQQKALQQQFDNRCRAIQMMIKEGLIDGDPAHMELIAEVLSHPDFPWAQHQAQRPQHWALYAVRHAHEVALNLRKVKSSKRNDAGSKSISGAPAAGASYGNRDKGTGGVKDSIRRVQAVM